MANTAEQYFYTAALLPYKALQMTDAVLRTKFRMMISQKRLLEWEAAAATELRHGRNKWILLKHLSICSVVALVAFLLIDKSARIAAIPWLSVWFISPVIGHLISLPRKDRVTQIQPADRQWLGQVASGTWAFFEQFVNPEGHWLPPDNVQDFPREKVACRISPTNEGLFLVSGLVARRMGFIGMESLVELWEKNLASWNSLEQLHGHHFNWYETSSLKALHPYYVSTVDSGNLMACYFTLCEGIADEGQQPLIGTNHHSGAMASLSWLNQRIEAEHSQIDEDTDDALQRRSQLQALKTLIEDLSQKIVLDGNTFNGLFSFLESLQLAADKFNVWAAEQSRMIRKNAWNVDKTILLRQVRIVAGRFHGIGRDAAQFMPWLPLAAALELSRDDGNATLNLLKHVLVPGIGLRELAQTSAVLESTALTGPESTEAETQFAQTNSETTSTGASETSTIVGRELISLIREGSRAAAKILERMTAIRDQCESAANKMDFRFLYNTRRKLFSIGYNVDIGKLDRGHYDLLCSECRVASYLAIAKDDVETEHWFRLGRQATHIDGQYTLLSWGGTMFEYLMPQLFQRSYEGSLIDTSCRTAVEQQTDYGRTRSMPWGISESACAAMASNSDYQYKSFGVPGLGLKRGLSKDMVVSPYSSALALSLSPKSAMSNLKRLADVALGRWGFYDAVDYTPGRLRRNQTANVVRNYMAHHQGMTLLAIANVTDDQIVSRWFHAHPLVRANELLLQERIPSLVNSEVPNPRSKCGSSAIANHKSRRNTAAD
ncbi:MAG: glucoamylase family protein [Planctomycetaceae bacterium]